MLFHRTRTWLVGLAVLACGAAVGRAQTPPQNQLVRQSDYEGTGHDDTHYQPFGPVDMGNVSDMQIWQPPDLSEYGNYPRPNVGPWFQYERLFWGIHSPQHTQIGDPNSDQFIDLSNSPDSPIQSLTFHNDQDTTFIKSLMRWGNRFEFGYMTDDNEGWMMSILKTNPQISRMISFTPTQVVFRDPLGVATGYLPSLGFEFHDADLTNNGVYGRPLNNQSESTGGITITPPPVNTFPLDTSGNLAGTTAADSGLFPNGDRIRLPIIFLPTTTQTVNGVTTALTSPLPALAAMNTSYLTGVELMKVYRYPPAHNGAVWEWIYGVRFLQFHDRFQVDANGGMLDNSNWNCGVNNNMVGPQIGLRYARQHERWTFSSEFRFMAAADVENTSLSGVLNGNLVTNPTVGLIHNQAQVFSQGPNLDPVFPIQNMPQGLFGTTFTHGQTDIEFAPLGELRVDCEYQVTQNAALKVGYTALFAGGVSRAAQRIDYVLPSMGILNSNKWETLFANGLSIGFEINR